MERILEELEKLVAEARNSPPFSMSGFHITLGADGEPYLLTRVTGSSSYRVLCRDATGRAVEMTRLPVGEWYSPYRSVEPGESVWDLEQAGEEPWDFVVERPGRTPLRFQLGTRSVIG